VALQRWRAAMECYVGLKLEENGARTVKPELLTGNPLAVAIQPDLGDWLLSGDQRNRGFTSIVVAPVVRRSAVPWIPSLGSGLSPNQSKNDIQSQFCRPCCPAPMNMFTGASNPAPIQTQFDDCGKGDCLVTTTFRDLWDGSIRTLDPIKPKTKPGMVLPWYRGKRYVRAKTGSVRSENPL